MLTVTTYTHPLDYNAHVSRFWFSSLPPLSMQPSWELCGQRAKAWVCGDGVIHLITQSTPTPQLSSHWLLWHQVHLRASACLIAQIYTTVHHTRLPAASTIKLSVFVAYKFLERCITSNLGTTYIDIWFGWGDGRGWNDNLVWLALWFLSPFRITAEWPIHTFLTCLSWMRC